MMAMAVVGGGSLLSPTPPADNEVLTSFFHALLMYFAVLFALLTFGVIILLAIKSKDRYGTVCTWLAGMKQYFTENKYSSCGGGAA